MLDNENDPVPADPPENGGGTDSDLNSDSTQDAKPADPPENGSGGGT